MSAVDPVVTRSPEVLGGTPVFRGTRVPVKTLIDYLEAGDSLEVFLQDFPTVSREQAAMGESVRKPDQPESFRTEKSEAGSGLATRCHLR